MGNDQSYHTSGAINPDFKVKKAGVRDLEYFIRGLEAGNKFVMSEAITLIESQIEDKSLIAGLLLDWAFKRSMQQTIRIAVTGTPGVGKSTFIEAFGKLVVNKGHKLSVLTIDPSSQQSKGSILGDKTRMAELSVSKDVFIRPSASGNILGGTAAYTKDAITICEAAGFDITIVETVGVGQSETEVNQMTDVSLLLLQPGAGDEIQGIKRGIMELADIFVINKADGQQTELASQTQKEYRNAVQLFHHTIPEWRQPVLKVSALSGDGLEKVWDALSEFIQISRSTGYYTQKRRQQEVRWFYRQIMQKTEQLIFSNKKIAEHFQKLHADVNGGAVGTPAAIRKMVHLINAEFQKVKDGV